MRKILYLAIFTIFCCSISFAQNTTIEGVIKGAEGKKIRVYAYEDLLTYSEKLIEQKEISADGTFKISLNISETSFIYLRLDFFQTALYVEKGEKYVLHFEEFKPFLYNEAVNPFLEPPLLSYKIINRDSNDLNFIISDFDRRYNFFISNNVVALIRGRDKELIDNFKNDIAENYNTTDNQYFNIYVKYKIALLEQSARVKSRQKLFTHHIYNQGIYVYNIGYMEFIHQYFSKFFTDVSRKIKFSDLEHTINTLASYPAILDSLGKDSILRNEYLREIVLTKGLGEIWEYPGFERENIIAILNTIKSKSKFADVRIMAENQISKLTRFSKGDSLAPITLKAINRKAASLGALKGKHVLLFFFNTSCASCIAEMEVLKDIYSNFPNKLEIIGVSIDMEPLVLNYFLENKKYDFIITHFDFDYTIFDNLKIRNIPFFILLDEDGNISRYPALMPSTGLINDLIRILR